MENKHDIHVENREKVLYDRMYHPKMKKQVGHLQAHPSL